MNRDILIEDLKLEIANNSYRESPMSLAKVVNVYDVYEIIDDFKNDLLHNVSKSYYSDDAIARMKTEYFEKGLKANK